MPFPNWRLPDLIDYESFLNVDERAPAEEVHRRDRLFFLDATGNAALPPRSLLRRWLDFRRGIARRESIAPEVILPGEAFSQVYALTRWTLIFLGVAIGWAAAAAALAYSANAEPINAFTFFVEFAMVQAAILVAAFGILLARHWFPEAQIPSLARMAFRLVGTVARSLWRRHRVRIAGTRRQNAEALFGILRSRHALYGTAFLWSLVILGQGFAISFNAGVLGAMAARHAFHDLDFGWESTWFDAGEISRGVDLAATPWAWALHPAHPTPAQVAGSQNRKRGANRLDPESLKSWSHFLFGAVVCYGLLPRICLLAFALRAQRRSLERLKFGDGRSAQVLNRLRTPTVETLGLPDEEPPPVAAPEPRPAPTIPLPAAKLPIAPAMPAAAFPAFPVTPPALEATVAKTAPVPPTPVAVPPPRAIAPPAPVAPPVAKPTAATPTPLLLVLNLTGRPFTPAQAAAAAGQPDASATVLEAGGLSLEDDERTFAALRSRSANASVAALIASWTAPMIASKLLLDQLRASAGRDTLLTLVLVGRPAPDGSYRAVRETDRALWTSAVNARGDAYLYLR